MCQYLPMPNLPLPSVAPKGNYGVLQFQTITKLLSNEGRQLATKVEVYENAPTFEELNVPRGIVLYEADVPSGTKDPAVLTADVADRALVYLDDYLVGTLSRTLKIHTLTLQNPYAEKIQILVENQGHLNFGNVAEDWKGIFNAQIDGQPLVNWTVRPFPLDNMEVVKTFQPLALATGNLINGPMLLQTTFNIPNTPLDTYLDTSGWGKGVVWVNGHNLGRYWPKTGPQVTLYVPSVWLNIGDNDVMVMEYEYVPKNLSMTFRAAPNLGRSYVPTQGDD